METTLIKSVKEINQKSKTRKIWHFLNNVKDSNQTNFLLYVKVNTL